MQIGISEPWWQPLTEVLCPATAFVASEPTIWDKINAFSTLAVAVFATVEVFRAFSETRARRRAADARLSVIAYALRRQINSWLEGITFDPSVLGIGLRDYQAWMQGIQIHFGSAETRLTDLAGQAAEASPAVKETVSLAYVRFYRATEIVNKYLQRGRIEAGYQDGHSAYQLLFQCVGNLERAITDDLKKAAESLPKAAAEQKAP